MAVTFSQSGGSTSYSSHVQITLSCTKGLSRSELRNNLLIFIIYTYIMMNVFVGILKIYTNFPNYSHFRNFGHYRIFLKITEFWEYDYRFNFLKVGISAPFTGNWAWLVKTLWNGGKDMHKMQKIRFKCELLGGLMCKLYWQKQQVVMKQVGPTFLLYMYIFKDDLIILQWLL